MKNSTFKTAKTFIILLFVAFGASSNLSAQAEKAAADTQTKLAIFIKSTAEGITLTCERGCEWKELTVKAADVNNIWAVDQSGLRIIKKEHVPADDSVFLFTIKHYKDQLLLKGLKGVSWKNLSIKCPESICTESFDEKGVTQLN
ncbi:MAG TPA: hypothetical protein VGB44_10995 [Flavobacterium sp.]|jgi:hypothetical protein